MDADGRSGPVCSSRASVCQEDKDVHVSLHFSQLWHPSALLGSSDTSSRICSRWRTILWLQSGVSFLDNIKNTECMGLLPPINLILATI